jgi:Outer membrane protein beta-barrel domain
LRSIFNPVSSIALQLFYLHSMKKILFFFLFLISSFIQAQAVMPYLNAGLSMPRNSYTPSGEQPKRRYNLGYTVGANLFFSNPERNVMGYLGFNYTQKGGIREFSDGTNQVTRIYETRFNAIGVELGTTLKREKSLFGVVGIGAGITACYLLGGYEDFTDTSNVTIRRTLSVGQKAPDDLFMVSIGFRAHLSFYLTDHFDLRLTYQGSFNELDLVNKNNLRDKGLMLTLGYWFHVQEKNY